MLFLAFEAAWNTDQAVCTCLWLCLLFHVLFYICCLWKINSSSSSPPLLGCINNVYGCRSTKAVFTLTDSARQVSWSRGKNVHCYMWRLSECQHGRDTQQVSCSELHDFIRCCYSSWTFYCRFDLQVTLQTNVLNHYNNSEQKFTFHILPFFILNLVTFAIKLIHFCF